ncbi:hypothetical protein LCGC14_0204840 [marine sediment metagenome]|uniref:Uncharacterized protein n=1 Tax=marine sediment metagenome TaxID=412755 RepID=A0A0F9X1Q7_9ZZZZ|nr:hypothetical protein [Phycisphaerae bacterium]
MDDRGIDRAVDAFISRVAGWLYLRFVLRWTAVWCFAWGTGVLILRYAIRAEPGPLLWGLAAVGGILIVGIVAAYRRAPSRTAVRAALDGSHRCGGLVMASREADLGAWRPPSLDPDRLTLRWHGRRPLALLAAAMAFVLISFMLPQRYLTTGPGRTMNIGSQAAALTEQIEALEEEGVIDEEQAADMEAKLDQIESEATGDDPVKTWEALDHLETTLADMADQAAEEAINDTEKLGQAGALADALDMTADELDPSALTAAMGELADMVSEARAECEAAGEALSDEMAQACENGTLSAEQLGELAEQLSQSQSGLGESLKRLAEARLIDAQTLAQLQRMAGQCDSGQLADFLKAACSGDGDGDGDLAGMSLAEVIRLGLADASGGDRPGRGGVSRGRGDAAMTWRDPTSKENTAFEEQVLPPASLAAIRDSERIGLSTGAPTVAEAGPSAGGALTRASAGGGSAHTRVVLPRHKAAVQRYFDRRRRSGEAP